MLARKGSRKIVVDGVAYRWQASRWKQKSERHSPADGSLDPQWLAVARQFGLGGVIEVSFTIGVELYDRPMSKIRATLCSHVVDGFLGYEQTTRITPRMVRMLIEQALSDGWDPTGRRNYEVTLVEHQDEPTQPALLVLPDTDLIQDIEGYKTRVRVVRLV